MLKSPASRGLAVTFVISTLCGVLHLYGVGLPLLLLFVVIFAVVGNYLPWIGVRWLDAAVTLVRSWFWAPEQGRFHRFRNQALHVEDDGRHVWIGGADVQAVLGTKDSDDVLAARHAGRWRHGSDGRLLLRADAVVEHLGTRAGRLDPAIVRFRRYIERDVIYPAQQRRLRR